jgi:ubiquinone/menaquinone biosynthesis C-methylase UbiE
MTITKEETSPDEIRSQVRHHYGKMAERPADKAASGCCGPEEDCASPDLELASMLYATEDVASLPEEVTTLSAGCGDPVTLASLQPGQTVVDLGSGGGIDCFLAAKRVGETGKVIGIDMTPQMLDRARANKAKLGVENVDFRLGEIEHLPVPDETADVVISNCVINLSTDKPQVFREAFRVLKPGGTFAVSDIVTDGPLPDVIVESLAAWYGCVAGALDQVDYIAALEEAGFADVELTAEEVNKELVEATIEELGLEDTIKASDGSPRKAFFMVDGELKEIDLGDAKPPFSARITARKPLD